MKFMIAFFAMILLAVSFASAINSTDITYPSVVNNSQGYFNIVVYIKERAIVCGFAASPRW